MGVVFNPTTAELDFTGSGVGTDEKVKYDAGDPTAGYVADKVIAGTGISVAEGTGANENKLVVTNTDKGSDVDLSGLVPYTGADANVDIGNYELVSDKDGSTGLMKHTTTTGAISYVTDNSSNWNTAYGWGNHTGLYISNVLNSGNIIVGNSSNVATSVALSGDAVISNTGVLGVNKTRLNVRNETGTTIVSTRAVYVSGFNGYPLITLADNTDENKHNVAGLTIAPIAHQADGFIATSGQCDAETNTWPVGTELYLSTAGALTSTQPTSGIVQHVGIVTVRENYPVGKILLYSKTEPYITATPASTDAIIRMGDSAGTNKVSFRDYANSEVASVDSDGKMVIAALNPALGTGLVKHTTTTGVLTVITDASANWNTAYSHVTNNGSDHSYIDQSVVSGATPTFGDIKGETKVTHVTIMYPYGAYAIDTQIPIFKAKAALTVTKIDVSLNATGNQVLGDLKKATDLTSFTGAAVVQNFDTTTGVRVATGLTAAVAANDWLYLEFSSQPNAAITFMCINIWWDYDA
jgi:hypothetical protein